MTIQSLFGRVKKAGYAFNFKSLNTVNKVFIFTVNNVTIEAYYSVTSGIVTTYAHNIGYNESTQEQRYLFFDSLNKAVQFANS